MSFTTLPTSAYSTLDATKLSGNLPALNGSSLTNIDGGKIVGHAHAITSSETATNSSSAVATNLTVNYTATSTSNSLLIFVNHAQYYMNSPDQGLILELWKDSSVLDRIQQGVGYSDSAAHISGGSFVYKASIGDTNSHTYKTMFWRQVGSGYVYTQVNTSASSITIQEIAS